MAFRAWRHARHRALKDSFTQLRAQSEAMAQTLQRRAEAVEGLRIEVSEQQTMFKHYKQNAEIGLANKQAHVHAVVAAIHHIDHKFSEPLIPHAYSKEIGHDLNVSQL